MATKPLSPVPNTTIAPNPTDDAIWHRWFEELRSRVGTGGGGSGTVTSINVAGSGLLTFTGGPVTSSGTITAQTGDVLAFAAAHG